MSLKFIIENDAGYRSTFDRTGRLVKDECKFKFGQHRKSRFHTREMMAAHTIYRATRAKSQNPYLAIGLTYPLLRGWVMRMEHTDASDLEQDPDDLLSGFYRV